MKDKRSITKIPVSKMESFIELVRANPCLYDASRKDHHDKIKVQNIWTSLAKKMNCPQISVAMWKTKWKSQKNAYKKYRKVINSQKSGQARDEAIEKAKNWPYFEMMKFLDKHNNEASTESNMSSIIEESDHDTEVMEEVEYTESDTAEIHLESDTDDERESFIVSALGIVERDVIQVQKKWDNLKTSSKKLYSEFERERKKTGGGPPPKPLSAVTEKVISIIGRTNETLCGIEGGVDSLSNQEMIIFETVDAFNTDDNVFVDTSSSSSLTTTVNNGNYILHPSSTVVTIPDVNNTVQSSIQSLPVAVSRNDTTVNRKESQRPRNDHSLQLQSEVLRMQKEVMDKQIEDLALKKDLYKYMKENMDLQKEVLQKARTLLDSGCFLEVVTQTCVGQSETLAVQEE